MYSLKCEILSGGSKCKKHIDRLDVWLLLPSYPLRSFSHCWFGQPWVWLRQWPKPWWMLVFAPGKPPNWCFLHQRVFPTGVCAGVGNPQSPPNTITLQPISHGQGWKNAGNPNQCTSEYPKIHQIHKDPQNVLKQPKHSNLNLTRKYAFC